MSQDPEFEFLQRLSRTAAQTLDAPAMIDLVITETTNAVDADVCSVYLLDPDGVSLRLTATNGLSQAGVGQVTLRVGEGITGSAAATRRAVVVPDVREDRRFRWMVGVDQARFVSMCSVPIISADRLIGVLNVQTDETRHFTMGDVGFLTSIAAQVAGVFERTALQAQLEAQIAGLHRAQEIHRRFTQLALEAADLDRICREIAAHTGLHVAAYDNVGTRLTSSDDDRFPDTVPNRGTATEDDGAGYRVTPIGAGGHRLGWLATCPEPGDDGESRRDAVTALEHGVTVLTLAMGRRRAAAETEERLRGDFLEELLSPSLGPDDAERIIERGARLGYPLRRNMWVVVIVPHDAPARAALRDATMSTDIRRAVTAVADARHPGSIVVAQPTALVCLIAEPAAPDHVEAVAGLALKEVCDIGGGDFSAGVSGRAGAAATLAARASEAYMAERIGRRLGRRRSVSAHRRLGAERMLAAVAPDGALAEFVDEWLGPLLGPSAREGAGPLLETLVVLTDTSWSLRESARRLDETVNVVAGRIQRLREVLRRDLDDGDVRLSLALALRARTLDAEGTPESGAVILSAVEDVTG